MSRFPVPWMSLPLAALMASLGTPAAWPQQPATDSSRSAQQSRADGAGDNQRLDVRYYETMLELAKLDLQTAVRANRRVPNLTRDLTMLRLENQVQYAAALLEQAKSGEDQRDWHAVHLQSLQNELELAKRRLQWAEENREEAVGRVPEQDLKRLRLSVRLARLALQRAKNLEATADPLHHLQWQVERLRSELLRLRLEFERTRVGE